MNNPAPSSSLRFGIHTLRIATTLLVFASSASAAQIGSQPDKASMPPAHSQDWKKFVEIPAIRDPSGVVELAGSTLELSDQQGWLVVRRTTAGGEFEWEVVLARRNAAEPPTVEVDAAHGSFSLTCGAHFIRENFGALRILREPKTPDSPPYPFLAPKDEPTALGESGAGVRIRGWTSRDWCWMESGPAEQSDVRIRLAPTESAGASHGFGNRQTLAGMFFARARVQDEGDLLIAERALPDLVKQGERAEQLKQTLKKEAAPGLTTGEWFNTTRELLLSELRGKVVLLDFWGQWCGPCVKNIPHVQKLSDTYRDRGLIVIGIHSAQSAQNLDAFIKKQGITFPIGVDKGDTARRFAVQAWPTYFLLNKAGDLVWGFSHVPPTEAQIEGLLE